ncbi:MAG TPA: Ig-like domain-containing protein [Rudaea sp.]|nr:Ig-like domain-containing protein [Rudaea sp.]
MYNASTSRGTSQPRLLNVTFSGNNADVGGAIYDFEQSSGVIDAKLINVILWGDSAPAGGAEVKHDAAFPLAILWSVVEGGCPDASLCTNLFVTDPKLGPLAENGGFTRTLLPGFGSSAIDTGSDGNCPAMDQRGLSRPQGPHCEIGAVEVIPTPPPVADPKSVVTPENTPVQITLSGSDSNPAGPLSYVVNTAVQFGSASIVGNIVTYTPSTNFTGFDSFLYSVTDTNGTSTPAKVTIEVTRIPPVAKSFSVNVPHNTPLSMKVSATDANAGGPFSMTYAIVTAASTAHGTISLSGDTATYTPVHNYTGLDEYEYTATDVNGTSLPATVTIHVAPAPPVADDESVTTPYNTSKQITLSGSDNDNLGGPFALTFALTSSVSHGTLGAISGNTITYTPSHDYSGPDSFTYDTIDVNGQSTPALVQITVLPPGVGPPPPSNTTAIPTLGTWALLALASLIGLMPLARARKRKI